MELNIQTAELALREAAESNPGAWADHSRFVAEACKNIASHCKDLSSEQAYIFGLLHDIGRYAGVSSERHLIDGYRYCMERGWGKAAQICISHAFMIQDIATSIGVFDVSDEDYLFMKEFVACGMVLGKPSSTYPFSQSASAMRSNSIPMVTSSGTSCP